ncbi:uncharacterized protein ARMOST_21510 [Armillaria ostoyae]|uniref:Uncharacterized protein n=1 Tax=Armillaria ostoyae TaxID=47428 RepID=A0A284SAD3_ARMOS|nr:uncharacterized protein ARMOST_21510 [Armillaria ostoyae]
MFDKLFERTPQRNLYPQDWQYTSPPQYTPTPQSYPATQSMSTPKSQKYIRVSKGDMYYIFLKSQVPTYEWLIYQIRKYFPGMYRWTRNRWRPISIDIQTYDLPSCRGIYSVSIPPNSWTTVITDIDNIYIVSSIQLSICHWNR